MKKICCWIDESTRLKLLQRIKNLGAQLLVTYPRGFHQKYHSRELFHKRSKDSMYHRMLRKNQTLEAKCHEKDLLLESRDNKIEALEAKCHSKDVLLKSQNREIEVLRWQIQELQVLLRMQNNDHFARDNKIEAFATNQESRCPTFGDAPKGFSSKISEQRTISQKIKRPIVSQNVQE